MKNISLNGEPIELSVTIKYIVIDALYINEIRTELAHLKRDDIFDEIRNIVFPYTYNPFAEFVPEGKVFRIDQIKNVDHDKIDVNDIGVFTTDSGVVIFVNKKLFVDFASKFDYDELMDSPTDSLNLDYWNSIIDDFNLFDIALIVSTGINTGTDFQGSGIYKL
ncbi:hypothetical protein ABE426_06635 [Sphingobacterium faecium]|uniref:hypothetical protein n=1 Tax=Sphingobacterium faecium TaxID=34087 RepID=UPI00320BB109